MSAEKRKVSTDALETLGTHPLDETAKRDAIHLAVEPVIAGEQLWAGQNIGIEKGVATSKAEKLLGIVDPFLKKPVYPDEKFWLIVYPRVITSLRHVWSHPEFEEEKENIEDKKNPPMKAPYDPVEEAKQWITDWAAGHDLSYEKVMSYARIWVESERTGSYPSYIVNGGQFEGEHVPGEFWDNFEIVTGDKVNGQERGTFFSCSC